ncbi:hypothetical protein V8F33_013607 [Rhypophila sp. PSN 637]
MAPVRPSLKAFLATARKALASPPTQTSAPLTFVLGNESADLDSLCSAVILAYFRSQIPPHTLHIPLSHLPRADLALRPELNAVLRPAGLTNDDLLTLSDLPGPETLGPENTRWLLVDHNAPTGELAARFMSSQDSLIGCIDHHADEGKIPQDVSSRSGGGPRVIEKSGSCMSLVVDHCRSTWEKLSSSSSSSQDIEIDAQVAHLALGPILIDTTNLTSKDKTTERDISAVKFAESMIAAPILTLSTNSHESNNNKGPYSRSEYFDQITHLKEEIKSLSYRDLLRKDYKQWTEGPLTLGTCVIMRGFSYLLQEIGPKEEFLDAIQKWKDEQGLDLVAVMTVSKQEGEFTRELLVWAFGETAIRVARQFVDDFGGKLGLERWNKGSGELDLDDGQEGQGWRMCWRQRGVESSRKQVAPMLRDAINKAGSKL